MITITFYAQDIAGNIGTETVAIIKQISPKSKENLLLTASIITISSIGGTIGASGIIIFLQRKKIINIKKSYENLRNKLKKIFNKNASNR